MTLPEHFEEPSKIISASKYDNCNLNYSPEKFVKVVQNSNSASISSSGLSAKTDNPVLSNFNSNCENLFSSSKRPNININSFKSTSKLISSSTGSLNVFMSRDTVIYRLQQLSNASCTGKYGKYNINTSQQSNDAVQNFNSDLLLPVFLVYTLISQLLILI